VKTLSLSSSRKDQIIDITPEVSDLVRTNGVKNGICFVYVPHTTAGVTINENADPDVKSDMLKGLSKIVPDLNYEHGEGNSPAHIKASLVGSFVDIIIEKGRLALGTWQGIYFCEFDGPRTRKVFIKMLEG